MLLQQGYAYIVKQRWEHKTWIHINMGVSQILSMYIISLIGIAFKHNEHENQ